MQPNMRLFIRSLKNVVITNNPVILFFEYCRKILDISSELPKTSCDISKNISKNKIKLEKTRSIIEKGSLKMSSGSINIIQ